MPKQGKNIYLRKDGRWEGRFIKDRIAGKAQYGYVFGKSYEEAELKLKAASDENTASSHNREASFAELSNEWILLRTPQLKASSVAKYTNMLDLYLLPTFGDKSVSVISRTDIMQWSRELLTAGGVKANGLAPKTVNSILSLMRNILEFASREKETPIADTKDISVIQPQKPMRILSRAEQQRLSGYLRENLTPCNVGILLCLYAKQSVDMGDVWGNAGKVLDDIKKKRQQEAKAAEEQKRRQELQAKEEQERKERLAEAERERKRKEHRNKTLHTLYCICWVIFFGWFAFIRYSVFKLKDAYGFNVEAATAVFLVIVAAWNFLEKVSDAYSAAPKILSFIFFGGYLLGAGTIKFTQWGYGAVSLARKLKFLGINILILIAVIVVFSLIGKAVRKSMK